MSYGDKLRFMFLFRSNHSTNRAFIIIVVKHLIITFFYFLRPLKIDYNIFFSLYVAHEPPKMMLY